MRPQDFVELFEKEGSVPPVDALNNLVGRIFRFPKEGASPQLRLSLAVDKDDPENPQTKPFVFFMGGDGLHMMLKHGRSQVLQSMINLGINESWIRMQLDRGCTFALIVRALDNDCSPATWNGLFTCMKRSEPKLSPFVSQFGEECASLKNFTQLDEFGQLYGDVDSVEAADIMLHPHLFPTPRRFLNIHHKTVIHFRVLAWQWYGANIHFQGDGRTAPSTTAGIIGNDAAPPPRLTEFFVPNNSLAAFEAQGAVILPLSISDVTVA